LVTPTREGNRWQTFHHGGHPERAERKLAKKAAAAAWREAVRNTDSQMAELRSFLESLGDWMPKALVDSTVAASRARRLAKIKEHGLQEVQWRESISKAVHARITAIMDSAGGRRNPQIARYLAYETETSIADAVAQLSLCVSEVPAGLSQMRN